MGKTYVLDRVAADLARGSTHPAIQRLSSLVAAYPNDLDLRRRLAAVHRRVGNRIQAGRWDYLTIGADTRDTHAFERAFPSAAVRLREVRWPYRASEAATAYARRRLAKLIAAAEAERPWRPAPSTAPAQVRAETDPPRQPAPSTTDARVDGRVRHRWRTLAARWSRLPRPRRRTAAATSVATAPFVVLGMVTVVEWLIG